MKEYLIYVVGSQDLIIVEVEDNLQEVYFSKLRNGDSAMEIV